jgi:hypothetical protein
MLEIEESRARQDLTHANATESQILQAGQAPRPPGR